MYEQLVVQIDRARAEWDRLDRARRRTRMLQMIAVLAFAGVVAAFGL